MKHLYLWKYYKIQKGQLYISLICWMDWQCKILFALLLTLFWTAFCLVSTTTDCINRLFFYIISTFVCCILFHSLVRDVRRQPMRNGLIYCTYDAVFTSAWLLASLLTRNKMDSPILVLLDLAFFDKQTKWCKVEINVICSHFALRRDVLTVRCDIGEWVNSTQC